VRVPNPKDPKLPPYYWNKESKETTWARPSAKRSREGVNLSVWRMKEKKKDEDRK
jgi:hypothetical protein